MVIKKESPPLATGFFSRGNICFNLKFPFTDEFSIENRLGKDLINFAWFDPALIDEIFNILWERYIAYKTRKDQYDFIIAGLLDTCDGFLRLNAYFTVYLITAISFLVESQIDRRVVTYGKAIEDFAKAGYFVESDTGEMFDLDKRKFLDVFLDCIVERQSVVEETLSRTLGDANTDNGQSAMARLYRLENPGRSAGYLRQICEAERLFYCLSDNRYQFSN